MQGVLQQAVSVEESGTHGTLGDLEDFCNFGMGSSLNIEHGYDDSMVMRQLLHGGVQFFLQFMD